MNLYNDIEFINVDGNFIHRTALVHPNVKMGKGNRIMPYAVIGYPGAIRNVDDFKGKCVIEDNNFIGAYTCVMIGESGTTYIGFENIIMNHVNIGHNVDMSAKNEIGAGTIIGGHVIIGNENLIKSQCTIRNRIEISSMITVGQGSNVITDLFRVGGTYLGNPAK